jgi:hypothetical protein
MAAICCFCGCCRYEDDLGILRHWSHLPCIGCWARPWSGSRSCLCRGLKHRRNGFLQIGDPSWRRRRSEYNICSSPPLSPNHQAESESRKTGQGQTSSGSTSHAGLAVVSRNHPRPGLLCSRRPVTGSWFSPHYPGVPISEYTHCSYRRFGRKRRRDRQQESENMESWNSTVEY